MQLRLDTPLQSIQGITPARLRALNDHHITTLADLLRHYPRRYEDRRRFHTFDIVLGMDAVCLRGQITETKFSRFGHRCQYLLTLSELPATAISPGVRCRWFNQRYLSKIFQTGQELIIYGLPRTLKNGNVVFDHPEFEVLETGEADSDLIHLNRITPIYPAIGPWSPRMLRRLIFKILQQLSDEELQSMKSLLPSTAPTNPTPLRNIHFPESDEALDQARRVLALEELVEMQCILLHQRQCQTSGEAPLIPRRSALMTQFLRRLPFQFTAAQKRALTAIFDDLESSAPMNRLLHGDVGSGKTIVAATAILGTIAAGFHAALMAPTQILAQQHHATFRKLFEPLGISVLLHTSEQSDAAPTDSPHVTIGTHALLFAKDTSKNYALVVIDEQHKFGVRQRAQLAAKSSHPHTLVMSATPIPRTLALTLYGDLDLTLLDESPPGRLPIQTLVRSHKKLSEATAFLLKQLDAGHQAYIIYPIIKEGKLTHLKAATKEFERWRHILSPHGCALLHGQLSCEEKETTMQAFRDGDVRVLVSTTVIEVGVDIANANILIVENAERFGMAQLHQLRGRVGRGQNRAWCILLTGENADDKLPRLKIFEEAADGFSIAEADLLQRGTGDLLGTEQTGLPSLHLANLPRDLPLLESARKIAADLLAEDPTLSNFPNLKSRVFAGIA